MAAPPTTRRRPRVFSPERWSTRARVTAAYTVVMAAIVGVGGWILYHRLGVALHHGVVGPSGTIANADDALHDVGNLLLVGSPIALVIGGLVGYGVVRAALRPVEQMRSRAAEIQPGDAGVRLPVPASDDEVARLGDTLNGMLDRLEAGLARERQFVSDASHELRTPLAILRGELELALRDAESVDDFRRAAESAVVETDRVIALAEGLLVIARADERQLALRLEPIDPRAALEETRRRFAARAASMGAELTLELGDGTVTGARQGPRKGAELGLIEADPVRLGQALDNLVANALAYGDGAAVRLSAEPRDGQVALHVRDGGPGFPPEFIDHAFERFARGDEARSGEGAGLGLAIVAAIAQSHGGTAGARNIDGGGADVWIELPTVLI